MKNILIGVNLPAGNPSPEYLGQTLKQFSDDGYDCVEICLDTLPVITGGVLQMEYVNYMQSLCSSFPLRYSAHISCVVDLRRRDHYDMQEKVMFASIDLCSRLNLNPLVIHYDLRSKDVLSEQDFLEKHIKAAEFAAQRGIKLCIENLDRERVEPVVEFVRAVNLPNFRMTLDTGHVLLTSNYFHFDFLEAIQTCLPYIGHVHLNDNCGILDPLCIDNPALYDAVPLQWRFTLGLGDIHLPPFWGEVPFRDIFALLSDYQGIYLCEYNSQFFLPFNRSIQERVRQAVREAQIK